MGWSLYVQVSVGGVEISNPLKSSHALGCPPPSKARPAPTSELTRHGRFSQDSSKQWSSWSTCKQTFLSKIWSVLFYLFFSATVKRVWVLTKNLFNSFTFKTVTGRRIIHCCCNYTFVFCSVFFVPNYTVNRLSIESTLYVNILKTFFIILAGEICIGHACVFAWSVDFV